MSKDYTAVQEPESVQVDSLHGDLHAIMDLNRVPFKSSLSFEPLIEYIDTKCDHQQFSESLMAQNILEKLQQADNLRGPIRDLSVLEEHKDLVDLLISCVLPPVSRHQQLAKLSIPFDLNAFYETPAVKKLSAENKIKYDINRSTNLIYCSMVVSACSLVLNKYYGQDLKVDPPISINIRPTDSDVVRHYKLSLDMNFVKVKPTQPLRSLSQEQINALLSNIYDIDLWMQCIPPEAFEFEGFSISTLIDITEEQSLSYLKQQLLLKDAIVNQNNIDKLQRIVRNYLELPDLKLGITAIDYPVERSVAHKYKIRFDFLAHRQENLLDVDNTNSIYEKACKFREVLLIEDLQEVSNKTPVEEDLLSEGFRSIIVAPLFNKQDQVIGLLEIGSPRPYALHSFIELKFKDILGLFSIAVERSRKEIDNKIEAVIREQFTDVHPSVEWRFVEASYNLLEHREQQGMDVNIEPILFKEVYPLYGQADIVSSSSKRNQAIQTDLIQNLDKAISVLDSCINAVEFPLARQHKLLLQRNLDDIKREFNSNDESRVVEILHDAIHPMLQFFRNKYPSLAPRISNYFDGLDPELGVIYDKRKQYEDSVDIINRDIANYLEERERISQKVLPHYFAKYKTDGVEYDMYFGQSLLNNEQFELMHLKNFRLWQLLDMVEITRRVEQLQGSLPVPLNTAQLIFVYTNPLSIRFRQDEKQFDVDGAYNVRYEILKKRIDKATIENSEERITQAGKIAIVYLQEKDKQEYIEYIDYLLAEGLIEDNVEDLKIGKLQGAQGLRALRLTVKLPQES